MSLRGYVGLGLAATLTLLGVAGCSSGNGGSQSGAGDASITIAVGGGLNKQNQIPIELASRLGFFSKQGLTVRLDEVSNSTAAEEALLSGHVQAVADAYDSVVKLAAKHQSLESVVLYDQSLDETLLVASSDVGRIGTPAQLKGMRIGVDGLSGTASNLVNDIAQRAGVSSSEYSLINVSGGAPEIAALRHGEVQAAMTTDPTTTEALNNGTGQGLVDLRTLSGTRAAVGGAYPSGSIFMPSSWVDAHKQTVQKLVNAVVEALKWIQTHDAAQITDEMPASFYSGIGKQLYEEALANGKGIYSPTGLIPTDGPASVYQVLHATDKSMKNATVDLSKTYTNTFVEQAQHG